MWLGRPMFSAIPLPVMEKAIQSRDRSFDGLFFVGITSTNIFCRPSCPARAALPKNRRYFQNAQQAIFAGFRPCKRCHPLHADGSVPDWLKPLLNQVDRDPEKRIRDQDLRDMNIDPARVRRYFHKQYGMTFQAYCRGRRLSHAFENIQKGASLDDVVFDHSYESHSGFRDAFGKTFGLSPGKSKVSDCIQMTWIETPVGPLVCGATSQGVCLVEFTDRRMLEKQIETLRRRFRKPLIPGSNKHLENLRSELSEYFDGRLRKFRVPLAYLGTPFQEKVWTALLEIPYGTTCTYEDIARVTGHPQAVRAVGTANGMNRIAIVIPCHRVVNKGGKLGGYGGGLHRKRYLLDLEYRTMGHGLASNRSPWASEPQNQIEIGFPKRTKSSARSEVHR